MPGIESPSPAWKPSKLLTKLRIQHEGMGGAKAGGVRKRGAGGVEKARKEQKQV